MRLIAIMLLLGVFCPCVGCEKRQEKTPPNTPASQPSDPVRAAIRWPAAIPCSDGTVYVLDERGGRKALWLVNGKAVEITLDDRVSSLGEPFGDFTGGIYVVGREHLWYMKSGVANPVVLVPLAAITPEEHAVTSQSANWASLATYGRLQFEKGFEEGMETAREE